MDAFRKEMKVFVTFGTCDKMVKMDNGVTTIKSVYYGEK